MDKLEQYLDQVCRSIGGPRSMREHVRQELREHLLDAVAQHKAAGLSEEQAIDKALEEFGKPDEVRQDLEATHGQRTMWLIDKALEWKEMTMRAKWLWATGAYLTLITVIALEVFFITFSVLFLVPKIHKLMHDGLIDTSELRDHDMMWLVNFLNQVSYIGGNYTWAFILGPLILWGLFEWRVQSENKTFMRLSALGAVAVALMIVVILMTAGMVIPYQLAAPAMGPMARPWAIERVNDIDTAVIALEKARKDKDWPLMQKEAEKAWGHANLLNIGPAPMSLAPRHDPVKAEEMRAHARGIERTLNHAKEAIREHDDQKLDAALQEYRKVYAPVREATKVSR